MSARDLILEALDDGPLPIPVIAQRKRLKPESVQARLTELRRERLVRSIPIKNRRGAAGVPIRLYEATL